MKKIISTVVVLLFVVTTTNAQNSDSIKLFQKITGGAILGTLTSTSFSGNKKPFDYGSNLLANMTIFTNKTYHMFRYGFGNNSLSSLNGCFLKNNWDVYVLYSKTLHTNDNYLSFGIEKMIKLENENKKGGIKCFLLTEIGTDLKGNESLSFGLLINVWNQLWKGSVR